jgi:hypothetical protein
MRDLFASEKRCISNLLQMKWNVSADVMPNVVSETYDIDRPKRHRFNCDFIISFINWGENASERAAAACSVLPNALGAELFLVVEKSTLLPTALELNGGEAYSISHYNEYVKCVETLVSEAICKQSWYEGLSRHYVRFRDAAFSRLLVVGDDITFLCFPTESQPVIRGKRFSLVERDDREVYCYIDGDVLVAFDGWLRRGKANPQGPLQQFAFQDSGMR